MRAGQLRHSIVIQTVTETNTGGVITNVWSEYDTVRAEALPVSGAELWAAKQVQDEEVVLFKLRYLSGVTQKMRVLHNYKAYDIKSVLDMRGRGREMHIRAVVYPQEYAEFSYSGVDVDAGDSAGDLVFTWDTDFYSSTRVRYQVKDAGSWTTATHDDTTTRVLSHSDTITSAFSASTTYEFQVYGENEAGWSPGWSDTYEVTLDGDSNPGEVT